MCKNIKIQTYTNTQTHKYQNPKTQTYKHTQIYKYPNTQTRQHKTINIHKYKQTNKKDTYKNTHPGVSQRDARGLSPCPAGGPGLVTPCCSWHSAGPWVQRIERTTHGPPKAPGLGSPPNATKGGETTMRRICEKGPRLQSSYPGPQCQRHNIPEPRITCIWTQRYSILKKYKNIKKK